MTTNYPAYSGEGLEDGSLLAPADWSGSDSNGTDQFRFVQGNASTYPNAQLPGGAHEDCLGILQNAPKSGEACQIRFIGVTKAQAGAAVAFMDPITNDANGNVVTATSGQIILGYALMPANAAKDIITVILNRGQATV